MEIGLQALYTTLKRWKANPDFARREIGALVSYQEGRNADEPFSDGEIRKMKKELKTAAPASYNELFQ